MSTTFHYHKGTIYNYLQASRSESAVTLSPRLHLRVPSSVGQQVTF